MLISISGDSLQILGFFISIEDIEVLQKHMAVSQR